MNDTSAEKGNFRLLRTEIAAEISSPRNGRGKIVGPIRIRNLAFLVRKLQGLVHFKLVIILFLSSIL